MLGVKHRIGGYRVIAPIGAGGFATVYRALDEETGKEVAIKVLAENHSLVADTRRRFEEEMGLLMTVKSPSIAKIYKVGETEAGQPFMVLELADRGDLRRRLEEIRGNHQVLNREDLTMLAHHLHDSLRHLHGMEIIHRDVSPGNILIRSREAGAERAAGITLLEPGERFLLTDLGHAKDMILASGFTAGGGTRGFASPEQRDDVTVVDHRADVFAATAILEWAAHDGLYAEALDPFFDIGLAADPEDRFDSMEEWRTSFSETMAATLFDGSRSKGWRVIRRLTPGKTPAIDDIADIADIHLDSFLPEMLMGDTTFARPLGGVTPPGVSSAAKVVRPPGSPGDQSIARSTSSEAKSNVSAADSDLPVSVPTQDNKRPGSKGLDKSNRAKDTKTKDTRTKGDASVGSELKGASPLTRVDPETLVDTLTAASFDDRPTRKKNRRLAFAVGALVVAGMVAFGLAQELGSPAITLDAGTDVASPSSSMVEVQQVAEEEPIAEEEPAEESLDDSAIEPKQPADLFVAVSPEGDESAQFASDAVEVGEAFDEPNQAEDVDANRPAVIISSPDLDEQLAPGALIITGRATAPQGIEWVEVSIRNLDTLLYWDAESEDFGSGWATVAVAVSTTNNKFTPWTIVIPEEQLSAGDYQIRTWVKAIGSTAAPRNDSRTVTVIGETQSE